MSKDGMIRGKDIADKDVFLVGQKIADSLDVTIKKLQELEKQYKASFKLMEVYAKKQYDLSRKFDKVRQEQEYLDLKKISDKTTKESIELLKKVESLELDISKATKDKIRLLRDANRFKNEEIRTKISELNLKNKEERSKKKSNKRTIEENELLKELRKNERERVKESLGLVGAYQKLNKKRTEAQKKLADLLATEKSDIKNQKEHQKQIDKTRHKYELLNKRVLAIDKATKNYTKNIGNYKSALQGLSGTFKSIISAFGVVGGVYTFVNVLKNGTDIVRNFGATMSNVAGIYRKSRKDIAGLEEEIVAVAGASVNTATEVAKLAESLATLGKSPEEVEKLLKPVNNLSIGLKASSDDAGEFLVQTMNAFGGSADEAEKYADVLATVRTSTSLDFQKMKDSFQYLSPISKALGKDVAYTGALIGLLADNGIKAERAGRLMGTAQQKLASEGKTLNGALEELNESKKQGATNNELLALSSELFGKQASSLGLILAENTGIVEKNAEEIRKNGGALDDLVKEQLQSLDAHIKILNSRWEEYILNTDKSTGVSNKLKKTISFLSNNISTLVNSLIISVKWFGIYKSIVFVSSNAVKIATTANTLYRLSVVAMNGGIRKAIIALRALKVATASSGVGLILVALGSAYELWSAFSDGAKEATKEMKKLNKEMDIFSRAQVRYAKDVLRLSKGMEQISGAFEGQEQILGRVSSRLKKYADEAYQYNSEHIRQAKKLIKETHETEISKIKEKINISATFSERQIKYLLQEIAGYQSLKKVIKDNEDYLDKKEKEREQKRKQSEKEAESRRRKILTESYRLTKFYKEQEIKFYKKISDDENENYNKRVEASKKLVAKQKELADLEAEYKLKLLNSFTKKEIEGLIRNGEGKKGLLKKLSTRELLIYEQLQAKKQDIENKHKEDIGKLYLTRLVELANLEEKAQTDLNKKTEDLRKEFQSGKIKDIKEYDKELAKLKFKNSKDLLNQQIDFLEKELSIYATTAEQKLTIEKKIAKARKKLNDLNFEKYKKEKKDAPDTPEEALKKKIEKIRVDFVKSSVEIANMFNVNGKVIANFFDLVTKKWDKSIDKAERFKQIAQSAIAVVGEIGNAVFERNIENIDAEIEANNQKYDLYIQNAQNKYDEDGRLIEDGDKRKEILEAERKKKEDKLKAEKRKEQLKQAKFNKNMKILDINIAMAVAIMQAYAQLGPIGGTIAAALITALGIAQLIAVASAPLPKYKLGRKGGKAEWAIVGDGGKQEVIETPKGDAYLTPAKDTLTYLGQGYTVHPTIEDFALDKDKDANYYRKLFSQSATYDINERIKKFQSSNIKQNNIDKQIMKLIEKNNIGIRKEIREGFKNIKIYNTTNVEIEDKWIR